MNKKKRKKRTQACTYLGYIPGASFKVSFHARVLIADSNSTISAQCGVDTRCFACRDEFKCVQSFLSYSILISLSHRN